MFAQAFLTSIGVGSGYWLGGEKQGSDWKDPNGTVIAALEERPPLEFETGGLCQMMGLKGGVLLPDDFNCEEKEIPKVGIYNSYSAKKEERSGYLDFLQLAGNVQIDKSETFLKSHNSPRKTEKRILQHPFCRKTCPFGEKKSKKASQCRKTGRGDTLASPVVVCYAKKRNNLFESVPWFKWLSLTPYSFVERCKTILVSSCGLKKESLVYSRFTS